MKFFIDDLPVSENSVSELRVLNHCAVTQIIFPYDRIYPGMSLLLGQDLVAQRAIAEQYAYMCDLKRTLDATVRYHHVLQETSTEFRRFLRGIVCLKCRQERARRSPFSLLLYHISRCVSTPSPVSSAFHGVPQFYPTRRKLIYCSRTVPEIEKALSELKRLVDYRMECAEADEQREKERNFYGIGLTSRKNLCIHPEVSPIALKKKQCFSSQRGVVMTSHMRMSLSSFWAYLFCRSRRRRRARWSMRDVGISQIPLCAPKVARILVLLNYATGMRFVHNGSDLNCASLLPRI